jgi:hypothetical protein
MAFALETDHFRNGLKAAVRIAKSDVRHAHRKPGTACACAGTHPIGEILDEEIPDEVLSRPHHRGDPGPVASSTAGGQVGL